MALPVAAPSLDSEGFDFSSHYIYAAQSFGPAGGWGGGGGLTYAPCVFARVSSAKGVEDGWTYQYQLNDDSGWTQGPTGTVLDEYEGAYQLTLKDLMEGPQRLSVRIHPDRMPKGLHTARRSRGQKQYHSIACYVTPFPFPPGSRAPTFC